jgi:superkiller protein 3
MRFVYHTLIFIVALSAGCTSSRDGGSKSPPAEETNSRKQQAHALILAEQYQAAIEVLLPLSTGGAVDSQVYSMLGKAYWKLGIYDQAVTNYESALRLDYGDAVAHLEFGEMLMEMDKVGRALTEFELAVNLSDRDALAHYNYGLALYRFGRRDAALAQWQIALSLDSRNAAYAEALGIGFTGSDDQKALGFFEQALELGAGGPEFNNNFGLLLIRLREFDRAERHFESAADADPTYEKYRLNLAVARLQGERYETAIPLLEALVASSENTTYRIYLGRAYYESKRFDDAIGLLEGWLQSNPTPVEGPSGGEGEPPPPGLNEAYDVLAMSFRGLGQLDKATVYIGKAVELQPGNSVHLNNYGVILAESGRIEEAKAQWRKVLRLEPDNEVAKQNLSAIDG